MKNFHLPLPERIDGALRAEARHDAIASYAEEMAGTELDLDRDLESAGIVQLLHMGRARE